MRYDFRKIQTAIAESGKTLRELQDHIGIDYSTISRAVKTGRAYPSTALALTKYFRVSMREIQIKKNGRRAA